MTTVSNFRPFSRRLLQITTLLLLLASLGVQSLPPVQRSQVPHIDSTLAQPAAASLAAPPAISQSPPTVPEPAVPLNARDVRKLPAELADKDELTGLRTADSATFDMGDGTYALVQDSQPMHYQDTQGNWQPITPVFTAVEDGWLNHTNALKTSLSQRSSDAKIAAADTGVGWEPQSLVAVGDDGQITTMATPLSESGAATSTPSADGRSVRYENNWSDPALQDQWRSGFGSAEYTMRLASLPTPPSSDGQTDSLDLRVHLHLAPGTMLQANGKTITPDDLPLETSRELAFASADGDTLWLQSPQIYEQDDPSARVAGSYRLTATADPTTLELSVRVPWNWLAASERRFPVVIDPLFQMRAGTTVRSPVYNPDFNYFVGYFTPGIGMSGDGQQRLLVKFAMPTQPPNTTVTQAYLVATPTGEGISNRDYLSQNVLAYSMLNDNWISSSDAQWIAPGQIQIISPGAQRMFYSEGDPNNPDRGVTWDVTTLVQNWFNSGPNYGIMLRTENEFCSINPNNCGVFYLGPVYGQDGDYAWTRDELQTIEDQSTESQPADLVSGNGGVRLMVFFSGPTLSEGQVIKPPIGYLANPSFSDPYFHADHEYRMTTALPTHWQAVVARGMGSTIGPNPPVFDVPLGQTLTGTVSLELRDTDDDLYVPYSDEDRRFQPNGNLSYLLLNGRAVSGRQHNLRVKPKDGGGVPLGYDVRLIGEKENLIAVSNSSIVRNYELDSGDPLTLWNVSFGGLPAGSNVRVDVEITGHNSRYWNDAGTLYNYAREFNAQLYRGGGGNYYQGFGSPHIVLGSNAPETGDIAYGTVRLSSPIFTPERSGSESDYALALGYNGPQMAILTTYYGGGEFPPFEERPMKFLYRVRVTACSEGTFPTKSGTCQQIQCPSTSFPAGNRRTHGGLQLWSETGWSASGPPAVSTLGLIAPLIGAQGDVAPHVAVVGGQISYYGTDAITLTADSTVLLVNCGSLASPTNPVTQNDYFTVYDGAMERAYFFDYILIPTGNGVQSLDAWRSEDRKAVDVTNEIFSVNPIPGMAYGSARLRRRVEGVEFLFSVVYSVDVGGWPSLDTTIDQINTPDPPTVASLILDVGDTLSLDVTPAGTNKTETRYLWNVRASDATISQPDELGGATKPVQALILPVSDPIPSDPPKDCAGSCIDLRAMDDTFESPNRVWEMPDVHTNVHAGTMVMSTKGHLQVYSVDHPAATTGAQSISQEFSFDTFGGAVSVEQEPCQEGGPVVTVIRGETRITMPNIGGGSSPDAMLDAKFKLCETSLRSVHFEFQSPIGIPIGSSGLFATALKGGVDIFADYTQVKFGLSFQSGDGNTFKGQGDVTIDTRGLFEFQGGGKILGQVDVDGKLWVAWNPLDTGFEMNLAYKSWLRGFVRAHMWQGQGWQHKYTWLPDNDDRHIAAQIAATLHIEQGAAFSWWFIDIPPDDMDFSVEVSFGEFCTNASCTSYEWGVKGKFSVAGYSVGLYYGFSHGFDFILGNDGHVLIDQYGGGAAQLQMQATYTDHVAVRAASAAINGVATETLTVSSTTESLLVALGWQAGAPQLTLLDPDGDDVTVSSAYTVAISTMTNSQLMGVQLKQPKPGLWKAVVGNLTGQEHYKFVYFASEGVPGTVENPGRFLTPGTGVEDGTDVYTITWEVPTGTPVSATISLYYTPYMEDELGAFWPDGVEDAPIVKNLPFSTGQYVWNTAGLLNRCFGGAYRCYYGVRAVVDDGVNDFPSGVASNPADPCQTRSELPSDRAFSPDRFPGLGTFSSAGKIVISDTVAPPAPTGLMVKGVNGAILARWDPSPAQDVAAYLVTWGTGVTITLPPPVFLWTSYKSQRVTAIISPSLRLGGVTSGTRYAVTVKAIDTNGNTSTASPKRFVIPSSAPEDQVPGKPQLFAVGSVTSNSASFSWKPAKGTPLPDSYRLVYRRLGTTSVSGYTDVTTTSATLTGLQTGATYAVNVSAADADGWRSASTQAISVTITNDVDGDGDGLPDDWATAYAVSLALADPDADDLINTLELELGTDPTLQDSDGDGFSDAEEYWAGANPLESTSFPAAFSQPRLALETNHLVFRAKKGQAEPAPQIVDYSNEGGGILKLGASSSATWIVPGVPLGGSVVQVAVDTSSLEPGYYAGVVRLNALMGGPTGSDPLIGQPQCIRVETWVSPADDDIPMWILHLPLVIRNG